MSEIGHTVIRLFLCGLWVLAIMARGSLAEEVILFAEAGTTHGDATAHLDQEASRDFRHLKCSRCATFP